MRAVPLLFLFAFQNCIAQPASHEREVWLGYIGSIRLSNKISFWNDYHFVPETFGVARFGLTYHATSRVQISGGHAWVWTSTSFTDGLVRGELRPWGQIVGQTKLGEKLAGQLRFRYDARFRQKLGENIVLDDLMFYHRLRVMMRVRFNLKEFSDDRSVHFNMMNELLYNTGGQVTDGIDQNRSYLLLGYTQRGFALLGGYHVRMIPQTAGGTRFAHGLTVWLLHTIDLRKRFKRAEDEPPPLPHGR